MKLEFKTLKAKDFLSLGDVEFNFVDNTVLLLGKNDDSASSDDNGSGKSSLAEALRWVLYGETVRATIDKSLPVEHVIRKGCKQAAVTLDMAVNGNPVSVTRTRTLKKFALKVVEGETEHIGKPSQGILNGILGINVIQFSNLVHLDGSYPDLFAPASDRVRKEILAELVDIAVVNQMQDLVKQKLAPIEAEITEKSAAADRWRMIEGQAIKDKAETQKKGMEAKARLQDTKDDLLDAQQTRAEINVKVMDAEAKVNDIRFQFSVAENEIERKLEEAQEALDTAQDNLRQASSSYLKDEMDATRKLIYSGEQSVNNLMLRISEMEGLQKMGKCPTCGQDTTEVGTEDIESLTSKVKGVEDEVREQKELLEELVEKRDRVVSDRTTSKEEALGKVGELRDEAKKIRREADAAAREAEAELAEARKELMAQDSICSNYKGAIRQYKGQLQELRATHKTAVERLGQAEEKINAANKRMDILHAEAVDLEFWKKGFGPKGVPSLFIETVLPQISSRIQKYADLLTGGDVTVTLKAYRETKSKTVQESIQILALNSKGGSCYGANSTGERNRIDLAVTLGLIEYFRDMNVFDCNVLMCDEIFDGLDNTGVEKALRALDVSEIPSVTIISHHDHLKPLFSKVLTAHKRGGVTEIRR